MSTDGQFWFSAGELAALGKAGVINIAGSERRAKDHAIKREWLSRIVASKGGRGGKRTEYLLPLEIQQQVSHFLFENPYFFGKHKARDRSMAAALHSPKLKPVINVEQPNSQYVVPLNHDALFEQQVGWSKAAIRLALIVRNQSQYAKASLDLHERVALAAFRALYAFCNGDLRSVIKALDDSDMISTVIHTAYETDCKQRGIEPGSDLKNVPWYQIHRKLSGE